MPIGVGYGLRGSLVHKCGMYLRDRNDLPAEKSGYIDGFLVPYFDNVVSWHEMMRIGTSCGDIYEMVDRELGLEKFGCTLNPGHLTHTDEWTNSPFVKGGQVKVASGMAFQCDYTVTCHDPFMSAHVVDGLIVAGRDSGRKWLPCPRAVGNGFRKEGILSSGNLGYSFPRRCFPFQI